MRKIVLLIVLIVALLFGGCVPAQVTGTTTIPNTSGAQQAGGFPALQADTSTQAAAPTESADPLATQAPTRTPTQAPIVSTLSPAQSLPLSVTGVDTAGSLVGYNYSGYACQATYTFEANISTVGSGTVTYYWQRSDGTRTKLASLTFNNSDFQKVKDYWTISSASPNISGTDQIVIIQPKQQAYTPAGVNVYCAPPVPTKRPSGGTGSAPSRKP